MESMWLLPLGDIIPHTLSLDKMWKMALTRAFDDIRLRVINLWGLFPGGAANTRRLLPVGPFSSKTWFLSPARPSTKKNCWRIVAHTAGLVYPVAWWSRNVFTPFLVDKREDIRTFLCCIVYHNCPQWCASTREQLQIFTDGFDLCFFVYNFMS